MTRPALGFKFDDGTSASMIDDLRRFPPPQPVFPGDCCQSPFYINFK